MNHPSHCPAGITNARSTGIALHIHALMTLVILLPAVCQALPIQDEPSTVGSITKNNGLTRNGKLVVKTPSILLTTTSTTIAPNPQAAIDQYDKLLEMSPDDEIKAEAMRRSADLRVQLADQDGAVDMVQIKKAIASYQQLLADVPNSPNNDRVLYQLARAYQIAGEPERGIDALRTLGAKYPESAHAGDAHFRVAELLYQHGSYAEAEQEYFSIVSAKAATGSSNASFFEPAQYKYGWSLYKQGKYEQAIPVFMAILDRELPQGQLSDPSSLSSAVAKNKLELTTDSLRVLSLSFAAMGGGKSVNAYLEKAGAEPRFSTLLYTSLGSLLLDKRRYTDAAGVYTAFIERHPDSSMVRDFQARTVAAYQRGGFDNLVIGAEESYVNVYAPDNASAAVAPNPERQIEVRKDLDDLANYYHARAKQDPASDAAAKRADFAAAARWYRKILALYPDDPKRVDTNLLYADVLYDGGQTREAATQYLHTAYDLGKNPKSEEAAFAAVQAYQRLGTEVGLAEHAGVMQESADASQKLADNFPAHPQRLAVLTRAGEDLYAIKNLDRAIVIADRVVQANPPAPAELRRKALAVLADAQFAQSRYAEAETAYSQLLAVTPADSTEYKTITEQRVASIYKQGESARNTGDMSAAAQKFQQAGQVAPDAGIRASAEFDAASAFFASENWPQAEAAFENFRLHNPGHSLIPDNDKKLALVYQKENKFWQAAETYARIAQRSAETVETRRDAAWLSATLYDQASQSEKATRAFAAYLRDYPQPLDRSQQARSRLADMALAENNRDRYLFLQREIVSADAAAGNSPSEQGRLAAARASLEIGRIDAEKARSLTLTAPLAKSLARRKDATETAIAALNRAAGYNFAEVTTAATFELGAVYRDFSRALMNSERPAKLKGDELEQYNLLLEEQADPFEEKAVKAYEANLQRMQQGVWDDWVRKSVVQLAEIAPAKYGKHEQGEGLYDSLR